MQQGHLPKQLHYCKLNTNMKSLPNRNKILILFFSRLTILSGNRTNRLVPDSVFIVERLTDRQKSIQSSNQWIYLVGDVIRFPLMEEKRVNHFPWAWTDTYDKDKFNGPKPIYLSWPDPIRSDPTRPVDINKSAARLVHLGFKSKTKVHVFSPPDSSSPLSLAA